jgi:hypothetical protein
MAPQMTPAAIQAAGCRDVTSEEAAELYVDDEPSAAIRIH